MNARFHDAHVEAERVLDSIDGSEGGAVKPHIVVTLHAGVARPEAPHWSAAVTTKTDVAEQLHPAIDAVLARWQRPVWVTSEYQPASGRWSADEIAAGLDRVYRLVLQRDGSIPEGMIADIALVPVVERVRPGVVGGAPLPQPVAAAMSNDTDRASRDAIQLAAAHRITRGDPTVTIAVLDTGVALSHPELAGVLEPGFDFVDILDGHADFVGDFLGADADPQDEVGHGTHVAGIVAARGIAMPAGVVPRCRILPVRALGAMRQGNERVGAGLVDNINNAVKWAIDHGADVINMSLGLRHAEGGLPHAEVVDYARRRDVTIVAASGNDGTERLYYPGALPHVIACAAFDPATGEIAPFSTYGKQVSLAAPGYEVYSSHLDDGYAFASGTSQASPFVAGAAALLKSYARQHAGARLSDAQVKHVLKHTADRVDQQWKDPKAGWGRINLRDALRLLEHRLAYRARDDRREAA